MILGLHRKSTVTPPMSQLIQVQHRASCIGELKLLWQQPYRHSIFNMEVAQRHMTFKRQKSQSNHDQTTKPLSSPEISQEVRVSLLQGG